MEENSGSMNDHGDELIELTRALQAEERRGTDLDHQRRLTIGKRKKLSFHPIAALVTFVRRLTEKRKRAVPNPTSLDLGTGETHDRGLSAP